MSAESAADEVGARTNDTLRDVLLGAQVKKRFGKVWYKGSVKDVRMDHKFPITVLFDDGQRETYREAEFRRTVVVIRQPPRREPSTRATTTPKCTKRTAPTPTSTALRAEDRNKRQQMENDDLLPRNLFGDGVSPMQSTHPTQTLLRTCCGCEVRDSNKQVVGDILRRAATLCSDAFTANGVTDGDYVLTKEDTGLRVRSSKCAHQCDSNLCEACTAISLRRCGGWVVHDEIAGALTARLIRNKGDAVAKNKWAHPFDCQGISSTGLYALYGESDSHVIRSVGCTKCVPMDARRDRTRCDACASLTNLQRDIHAATDMVTKDAEKHTRLDYLGAHGRAEEAARLKAKRVKELARIERRARHVREASSIVLNAEESAVARMAFEHVDKIARDDLASDPYALALFEEHQKAVRRCDKATGMRWSDAALAYAFSLVGRTSKGVYDELSRLFRLPSLSTVMRRKGAGETDGYSSATMATWDEVATKSGHARHSLARTGMLAFDSMKVKAGLIWNGSRVVGLAHDEREYSAIRAAFAQAARTAPSKDKSTDSIVKAQHHLVFYFTSTDVNAKIEFIAARFNVETITADFIFKHLHAIMRELYTFGFVVDVICGDGASENRSALRAFATMTFKDLEDDEHGGASTTSSIARHARVHV